MSADNESSAARLKTGSAGAPNAAFGAFGDGFPRHLLVSREPENRRGASNGHIDGRSSREADSPQHAQKLNSDTASGFKAAGLACWPRRFGRAGTKLAVRQCGAQCSEGDLSWL
jgi:hypothetical protein